MTMTTTTAARKGWCLDCACSKSETESKALAFAALAKARRRSYLSSHVRMSDSSLMPSRTHPHLRYPTHDAVATYLRYPAPANPNPSLRG